MRRAKWRAPERLTHFSEGVAVKVGISSIHNAGRGVFAEKDFAVGEAITYYDGYRISQRAKISKDDELYAIEDYDDHFFIIGFHKFKKGQNNWHGYGVAQLCNDPLYPCITGKHANVGFSFLSDKRTCIRALEPIKKGDELLVDYGGNYWEIRSKSLFGLDSDQRLYLAQHLLIKKVLVNLGFDFVVLECCHERQDQITLILKSINSQICPICNGTMFYLNLILNSSLTGAFLQIMSTCGDITLSKEIRK